MNSQSLTDRAHYVPRDIQKKNDDNPLLEFLALLFLPSHACHAGIFPVRIIVIFWTSLWKWIFDFILEDDEEWEAFVDHLEKLMEFSTKM